LEKAYKEGHQVFVKINSAEEADALNKALWTFRDASFIPHKLDSEAGKPAAPILISHEDAAKANDDLLVIIASELPNNFNDYQRIVVIVANDETVKQQARETFKQLKTSIQTINTHNIE
jgi:DNA polymerase-3 subunit chi